MNGISKWLLLLIALLFSSLFGRGTQANTINAPSCSQTDVQTALKSANSGDTVMIPAGTCTWTATLNYTAPGSISIIGAGNQSVVGGGDQTVIIDGVSHTPTDNATFQITTGAASTTFRLSGITFEQTSGTANETYNGLLRMAGNSQNVRVDHLHFLNVYAVNVDIDGWMFGVFDHNLFDLVSGSVNNGVRVGHGTWSGNSLGNGSWADSTTFGSNRFIFFENNTFNGGAADDCNDGGRIVFRYNTMNVSFFQTHEMENDYRGCRAFEFYKNMFNGNPSVVGNGNVIQTRMGTGLVWGNITGNTAITLLDMNQDRTQGPSQHSFSTTPNGWGYCGTTYGPSAWDQNNNSIGYPCIDQVGRGKGDLITGTFPSKVDSATGTVTWPNDALEPMYEWLDEYINAPGYTGGLCQTGDVNTIAPNRDFYCYTQTWNGSTYTGTAFNGTVGTGSGLLSARPSTCTQNVAYWATDTNTLYQCSATNTWTVYYTPYTYPHPLTLGSGTSQAPAPPSNVQATVE